jgi:hypothetical protein
MILPTVTTIRLSPKGLIRVGAELRLTGDSFIACHLYPDHPPILQVEDEHVSVAIHTADPTTATAEDVTQAHRLADALAEYIVELETLVTMSGTSAEDVAACGSGAARS